MSRIIKDAIKRKGPMARAAEKRPPNYRKLSAEAQWAIDKSLGILDWDGDPRK